MPLSYRVFGFFLVLLSVIACGAKKNNPPADTSVKTDTSTQDASTQDTNSGQDTTLPPQDTTVQLDAAATCQDDTISRTFATVGTATPISLGKLENLAVCGPQPDASAGDWFKFEVTGSKKQIHVLLVAETLADCAIPFVYAEENGKPKGQPQDDSLSGIFSSPDDAGPGKTAESHVLDPGTYFLQVIYAPNCSNQAGNGKYTLELKEGCTALGGDTFCASIHPVRGKFCANDACVGCNEDKDCPSSAPRCVGGTCSECSTNDDCKESFFGRKCLDSNYCGCAAETDCDEKSAGFECIADIEIPACGCSGTPTDNPTQGCVKDQKKNAYGLTCALNTCRCLKVENNSPVADPTQCTDSPFGAECDETALMCGCVASGTCADANKECKDFTEPVFGDKTKICLDKPAP